MGLLESPQPVGTGSKAILFNSMTKQNRKNVQSLSPILHIKWDLNPQNSKLLVILDPQNTEKGFKGFRLLVRCSAGVAFVVAASFVLCVWCLAFENLVNFEALQNQNQTARRSKFATARSR